MEQHNCKQEKEIWAIKEQIKTLFETMKKQDGLIESMHELTLTIRDLANETKNLKEDVKEIKTDVSDLKNRPAKRWNDVVGTVLKYVVGGVVGYVLFKLGLGS